MDECIDRTDPDVMRDRVHADGTQRTGRRKHSTLSLPGFDEELRDALDDAIRAGTVTDAEADTYLWLLQERPGRYDTFGQLIEIVRQVMTSN